jgi:hypothetical protein
MSQVAPIACVHLEAVTPTFDLPRIVAGIGTIRSYPRDADDADDDAANQHRCILDLDGIPEPQAIPMAINVVTAIRIASACSIRITRYSFPDGNSIDGFETDAPIWGHYESDLSEATIAWVETNLRALTPFVIADTYSRFGNAVRLHSSALGTQNSDLALLGCVGAIESLFSIAPQELSFRLSLQLAKFLGDTLEDQRQYFERARALYVVRSKIAHGDKISANEEQAAIQMVERWTPEAEELARLSLRRVVEEDLIDVFNSKTLHEALLLDLLFEANLDAAVAKRVRN